MTNSEASDGSFLQILAAVDNATLYSTNMSTMVRGVGRGKQHTTYEGSSEYQRSQQKGIGMPEYLNPSGEEVEVG